MKLYKLIFVGTLFLCNSLTFAKDIYTSKQKGNNTKEQFLKAYQKATKGDVIIVDTNITLNSTDKPLIISKNNITIKGISKNNTKVKITRDSNKDYLVKVSSENITFENILFQNANQQLYFENNNKLRNNITINNCHFKDGKYTGLNFRGKYKNINITNNLFENTKFSLQTMDCPILENFIIDNCKFIKGDHQISLDNPLATIISHKNIVIKNSTFELCERFNLALANTKNVTILNNNFKGGIQSYSQALHLEDRTQNVLVKNNTIKCIADVAILLYATDKIGHGTGRRLTESEKINSGCGNITLENNIIESGNTDSAISIGYGKGYFKILNSNSIITKNKAINTFKSKNTMLFNIDKSVTINNKTYQEIKNIKDKTIREQLIKIR